MIWFRIKSLEKLLIDGKVSDKLAFDYLLTHLILLTLGGYLSESTEYGWAVWAHFIISFVSVIWGVRKTFDINQKGSNKDYLTRFISLSFVTSIRLIALIIMVSVPLALVALIADQYNISFFKDPIQQQVVDLVVYLGLNIIFYYMLFSSFKRVNADGQVGRPVKEVQTT